MKPETTGREPDEGGERRFVPTQEWTRAFRDQWTPLLIRSAERYALRHSARLARVRTIDTSYAAELVQDILGDTMLGVITWDPERVELRKHVFDAIKSRIRHAIRHAYKFRPVRLDSCLAEVETALAEADRWKQQLIEINGEALAMLRDLADGDPEVILLLGAYDQRLTKRLPVMRFTKLTAKQYDAAWHRMRRLIDELPASLRAAAMETE